MIHRLQSERLQQRRGSILPAIVLAMLVSGGCLALVLNEYWLASAQEELRSATQAVALAAARQLASDDLLQQEMDPLQIATNCREQAQQQAIRNPVVGPVLPQMDVHLGRVVFDPATGNRQTLETDYSPNTVIVIGHRDRSAGNPVSLLAPLLAGRSAADVTVTVEASITNLVDGLRPFGAATVPAWPLAVLEVSSDSKVQTWTKEIEQRQGTDHFRWNDQTQQVEEQADGLPEILLKPKGQQGTNNLYLVNIGSGFQDDVLERQIQYGWSGVDLEPYEGTFSLKPGPLDLPATDNLSGVPDETLRTQMGQVRIFLLYSMTTTTEGNINVHVTRMVAGRLMNVSASTEGPQYVIQPAVVATRTALLDEEALYQGETTGNPYIYRVSITQ